MRSSLNRREMIGCSEPTEFGAYLGSFSLVSAELFEAVRTDRFDDQRESRVDGLSANGNTHTARYT